MDTNVERFMVWLRDFNPSLYEAAMARVMDSNGNGFSGLTDFVSSLSSALTTLAPQYLQYRSQKAVLDVQLQRMRAGQPPLDASQYQGPPVQVEHSINTGAGNFIQQYGLYLALGLAAVIVVPRLLKR